VTLGDPTPIQITVQVSDPKGVDNIKSVQIHTLVDGHENPSGISPPLNYTTLLANSGGGVYTGTIYPYIYSNFYTTYQLPQPVGVRVVVKNNDEHYALADTSIMVQPASTVKPVRVFENLLNYSTIHDAFAAVQQRGGCTVQARVYEFVEDLTLGSDIPVILKGGYDVGYYGNNGYSTLWGYLTLNQGSLVVENLIIK
jgi:hypothetical protein